VTERRVVAFGGGHGLYASLEALRGSTSDLTAVVTVSDDGGSSGRLRAELGVVPPGDLRMALSALCEDTEWGRTWRDVLQHRFTTAGELDGHAVGNLLIAALWDRTGGIVEGLDWVGKLLRAQGRVLPLAQEPLDIAADVRNNGEVTRVFGQVAVATAPGRIVGVYLTPARPKVPPETLAAIAAADMITLGPGSWYSSVLPHLMVPQVREAIIAASARCVLTLNIAHTDEETQGTTRADDIRALRSEAPDFRPAVVLVDKPHADDGDLRAALDGWDAALLIRDLRLVGAEDRHDPRRLADAYEESYAMIRSAVAADALG